MLAAHGARDDEVSAALLAYTANAFDVSPAHVDGTYPLDDEPSAAVWQGYAEQAGDDLLSYLRTRLVQLAFPVAEGTSGDPAYRAATRRGHWPAATRTEAGVELIAPGSLRLFLHPSPAGRVPVLLAGARVDFESLLRAFAHRNEPVDVPQAVGAAMIAGYNNWHRIGQLRADWQRRNPFGDWAAGWRELAPHTEQYQDRFVLASDGPYSGVEGAALGLDEATWRARSITIRVEHECAHYFTRRVLGVMRNALHDELIADYVGMAAAFGRFRADVWLRFLGLEDASGFRSSGRLARYRGDPPLPDAAFDVLQSLVRRIAHNLEVVAPDDAGLGGSTAGALARRARAICVLASTPLEAMADETGATALGDALRMG